jgi:hypothetical protein
MDGVKPCSTPISTIVALTTTSAAQFDDPTLYKSIVGGLHYLSFTRPDIHASTKTITLEMYKKDSALSQTLNLLLFILVS